MSLPAAVLVNTLTLGNRIKVDSISNIFINIEALFGLNRFNILDSASSVRKNIVTLYTIALNIAVLFTNCCFYYKNGVVYTRNIVDLGSYFFCTIFTSIACDRLQLFFRDMNNYDNEVNCQPKTRNFVKRNFIIHLIVVFVVFTTVFTIINRTLCIDMFKWQAIPMHLIRILELYFFGHLFSLIHPRMKLINFYIESSLTQCDKLVCKKPNDFTYFTRAGVPRDFSEITFLMDLYQIITTAHFRLVNAIKWQFLMILTASFLTCLDISYKVILELIKSSDAAEHSIWPIMSYIAFLTGNILCLFMPCIHGAKLSNEVHILRMLLTSRLYENNMDKRSRIASRALLALTEENDLSFTLLGMVPVDICLPLKYISLLITYLIIMLQFQKILS